MNCFVVVVFGLNRVSVMVKSLYLKYIFRIFIIYSVPLLGTGYIPCPQCANKSVEELVAVIDGNRDMDLQPFPVEAKKRPY